MVRCNAAKAMRGGSFSDIIYKLQLVAHDGVLSQKIVIGTIASAHHNVSYFNYSPLVQYMVSEKNNLQLSVNHIKHDKPTCWNSTLFI